MSLETQIAELNQNIQALIAALGTGARPAPAPEPAEVQVPPPAAKVSQLKPPKAETKQEPVAKAEPAPALTADDLRRAFLSLLDRRGRDVAMALLAEEGVSRAGELAPDRYTEVHRKISNLLKGH